MPGTTGSAPPEGGYVLPKATSITARMASRVRPEREGQASITRVNLGSSLPRPMATEPRGRAQRTGRLAAGRRTGSRLGSGFRDSFVAQSGMAIFDRVEGEEACSGLDAGRAAGPGRDVSSASNSEALIWSALGDCLRALLAATISELPPTAPSPCVRPSTVGA